MRARLFMVRSITSTISKHFTTNHTVAAHHLHHLRGLQVLFRSEELLRSFACHFSSEFNVVQTSNRLLRYQDHQTPTNARHTVLTFEAQPCSTQSPSIPYPESRNAYTTMSMKPQSLSITADYNTIW